MPATLMSATLMSAILVPATLVPAPNAGKDREPLARCANGTHGYAVPIGKANTHGP
jgi:hypothetical protein